MTEDLCQCPKCGRMHRHLGTPPRSVMEQIARDMREGTFPRKSEHTLREELEPRFFIDHGMIHDRVTGKHVTTDGEPPFEDSVEQVCDLLNSLAGASTSPLSSNNQRGE